MYRPNNYKNPHRESAVYKPGINSAVENAKYDAYEAGADAILEALRKKTIFYVFGNGDNSSGNIVFIPDNEE